LFGEEPEGHRSGYAALVGKPNVGKSTLMNALVGAKLSIVTHRCQIVFLDTPGVVEPRYRLHQSMMKSVAGAVREADVVLFMADARRDRPDELSLEHVPEIPTILVINKIDLVRPEEALPIVEAYTRVREFAAVVPISALKRRNLEDLKGEIVSRLPLAPRLYPADVLSEHPERFFVAEIIREKIFEQYRQEIPYSTQVNIVDHRESDAGKDVIEAEIVVDRKSQKGILIGRKGAALKRVGISARRDVEEFLGRPVYLRLFVKVREGWRDREGFLRSYGYE
jgi:GTP-binding protein Era